MFFDILQKVNIKSVGAISLIIFIALIFFSRTIYTHNLPVVNAVMPVTGRLSHMEVTRGTSRHESVRDLHSELGGTLERIFVREGGFVEKGQPIFEMSFGNGPEDVARNLETLQEDMLRRANENQISRNRLQLDIERIQANIERIGGNVSLLRAEVYEEDTVSDFELSGSRMDLERAGRELENSMALYEVGALSHAALSQAEESFIRARERYDHLNSSLEENRERAAENLSDRERARERQLEEYAFQLDNLHRDLRARTLDLDNLSLQEEAGQVSFNKQSDIFARSLQDFTDNQIIVAPTSGVVLSLTVNEGQIISAGQRMASFGVSGGFIVDTTLSLGNNFTTVSDTVLLSNASRSIRGSVTNITPVENGKRVSVFIEEEGVSAGETFELRFEKESAGSYTLIPNGAINRDSDGYFLNQIRRRDGILGREFFTERLSVMIGDSDLDHTVITRGITFFEPVVLHSDRSFSQGETILLQNESDFFDN